MYTQPTHGLVHVLIMLAIQFNLFCRIVMCMHNCGRGGGCGLQRSQSVVLRLQQAYVPLFAAYDLLQCNTQHCMCMVPAYPSSMTMRACKHVHGLLQSETCPHHA